MKHYQILTATQVISDPFPSNDAAFSSGASFYVRLQNTVNGDWDIESALADVAPASRVWETETGGIGYTSDDHVSAEFPFGAGLVYRATLGTGNQGPIGTVHETATKIAR